MSTNSFPSMLKELMIKTIVASPSQNFELFGQIMVHQLFKFSSIIYTAGGPIWVSRTCYIDFQLGIKILQKLFSSFLWFGTMTLQVFLLLFQYALAGYLHSISINPVRSLSIWSSSFAALWLKVAPVQTQPKEFLTGWWLHSRQLYDKSLIRIYTFLS